MTLRGLIEAGAVVEITRYAMRLRRRSALRRQRKQRLLGALAVAAGGGLLYWFISQRREATPAWVMKKQRKQARRDAARRERDRPAARPSEVHLQADAGTDLKVPLGDTLPWEQAK